MSKMKMRTKEFRTLKIKIKKKIKKKNKKLVKIRIKILKAVIYN